MSSKTSKMEVDSQSEQKSSNNRAGYGVSRVPKQADKAVKYVVDLYNSRNIGNPIDLSFNALIMVIIRIYDSIKRDKEFSGGYNEAARVIRRHLYNHLNLCILYKEDSEKDDGNA